MVVNPFWLGVAATIFVELLAMFLASVVIIVKRGKWDGNS